MKILSLDGLTEYNTNLINRVEDMIDDSIKDCINDISINESSIMFSKKDGTNENISLSISNADTLDGYHANDFVFLQNFISGKLDSKVIYYSTTVGKDCNDIEDFIVLAGGADGLHYPTANTYYYILTFKYSDAAKKQIAFGYKGTVVNDIIFRTCNDGVWSDWKGINANTAKNASGNVFQIYKDSTSTTEGGELQLQSQDGTFWNLDTVNNDFRIFDSTGKIHLRLDKSNSGNDYFIGNSASANNSDTVDGYHSYDFCHTAFAPSTNMNEVTTSGAYRINSGNTNAPSGSDWGQLFVIHGGGDTIAQLIFDFNQGRCWLRTGNPSDCGGVGAWTEWRQLYTTQNITYGTSELTARLDDPAVNSLVPYVIF